MNYKFRAWDRDLYVMYQHQQIMNIQADKGYAPSDMYDVFADKNLVVMASLGVTDCKGSEVFEGDLLQHPYKKNILYEVFREMNTGCYFLEPFVKGDRYLPLPRSIDPNPKIWDEMTNLGVYVVGNIFENINFINKYLYD